MNMERPVQITYILLRIVAGLLFAQSGALILFGWFGGIPQGQSAPLMSQTGIGGILEFAGGLMIMLGLFTRPVAFILSGEMAVAYWQFHAPNGTWPIQNQGLAAVLFCFVFLYMAARGAGDWSIDSWLLSKRGKSTSR
ncbi:MAG: DoxX family protein [Blastocatellia bacterium AA13]|nr:MAG: DoxX family protein [Blastocatellia bacterium AA13]